MPHVDVPYPYGKMPDYPHLRPRDKVIWDEFIDKNPGRFARVFYDYLVGQPGEAIPDIPTNIMNGWWDLTRWKIDVVAEDDNFLYCIEIKPNGNAHAIGKALAYGMLYAKQHRPAKPIICVALTDEFASTTLEVAEIINMMFQYVHKTDPVHTEPIHHVLEMQLWTPDQSLRPGLPEKTIPPTRQLKMLGI